MTMDLYSTQQDVFNYLTAQGDFAVYDTDYPEVVDEPTVNGYLDAYTVLRFNDAVKGLHNYGAKVTRPFALASCAVTKA